MESLLLAALHPVYTKEKQKKHSVRNEPAVMHVYLVQHGEAKSEEEDPQRRLTDKGIGEVQNVAKVLRPLKLAVDAIWHSGKARAQQTGELLAGTVWAWSRTARRSWPRGSGRRNERSTRTNRRRLDNPWPTSLTEMIPASLQ